MVSGGGQSSSGSASTGLTTSMSFVPALLANAFFGSGIGMNKGGFQMTGLQDFGPGGKSKRGTSSLVDPYGLSQVVGSNPLLGRNNPYSSRYDSPFSNFTGDGGGGNYGGGGGGSSDFLDSLNWGGSDPGGGLNFVPGSNTFSKLPVIGGLFDEGQSPEDAAMSKVSGLMKRSPGSMGLGQGGALNPFDLISNIMDLVNPGINPGIEGGMQGLMGGELGGMMGNSLLLGDVGPTLQEGLRTGFKPDLQPVIDEATRGFFSDIVPQLGQQNVAMQEGVGPFSTDLNASLTNAGGALASQLGSLEVENQNRAADRRGEMLGLSGLITDQLFNASTDAGRNRLDLGEQLAMMGTRGGRQSQLLQLLAGMTPSGPIQASSSQNSSKGAQGGIL